MPSPVRPARPPSMLMLLAGSPSLLRAFAMTAWILLLACGTMGTFAVVGAWASLRASYQSLQRRLPRRRVATRRPRWG